LPPPPVILVIDGEPQARKLLRASLRAAGWRMLDAATAEEGLSLAMQHTPDVVLLDPRLSDLDGLDVARKLRSWSHVPIIVLSSRKEEADKVEALDAGADDYVTKPFGVAELLARIRAALRRSAMSRATAPGGVFESGALKVDLEHRRVYVRASEIHLTPTEYKIVTTLVLHAGHVVTHKQLLEAVWGPRKDDAADALRVHITHLRRKLDPDPDPDGPRLITTEAGVGYVLRKY
jgi:two-component system KDP operon response regulator KdpE